MNTNDKIRDILRNISTCSVPDGFTDSVIKKIEIEKRRRSDRRETLMLVSFTAALAIMFSLLIFWIKSKYFTSETILPEPEFLSNYLTGFREILFTGESLIWLITGINISILLIAGKIISGKAAKG